MTSRSSIQTAKAHEKIHYISQTSFTLESQYSDLHLLGKGSYGVVVSAFSEKLQRKVAIKKITPVAKHVIDAKHVLREIRLLRHMGQHENIITMEDLHYREQHDEIYVVLELMDSDLHRIIQSKQQLSEQHYQYFMFQLMCGVKYLHDNRIIHRDLKPGNLLVSRDCRLRITDFGLARERPIGKGESIEEQVDQPMTEHVVTRWYRPPELMLCPDGLYSYGVDIWSCGCILAEMLRRDPLFPGNNFIEQLTLVFDVIGSPQESEVRHIVNIEARKFLQAQRLKKRVPFARIFPKSSLSACQLLDAMLLFDPDARITADDALRHEFLIPLQDPSHPMYSAKCLEFPSVDKNLFEFSFEQNAQLTRLQVKQMIVQEVSGFRREKHRERFAQAQLRAQSTAPQTESNSNPQAVPQSNGPDTTAVADGNANPRGEAKLKRADSMKSGVRTVRPSGAAVDSAKNGTTTSQPQPANGANNANANANANAGPSYLKGTTSSSGRSQSAPRMRPQDIAANHSAAQSGVARNAASRATNNRTVEVESAMKQVEDRLSEALKAADIPDAYDKLFARTTTLSKAPESPSLTNIRNTVAAVDKLFAQPSWTNSAASDSKTAPRQTHAVNNESKSSNGDSRPRNRAAIEEESEEGDDMLVFARDFRPITLNNKQSSETDKSKSMAVSPKKSMRFRASRYEDDDDIPATISRDAPLLPVSSPALKPAISAPFPSPMLQSVSNASPARHADDGIHSPTRKPLVQTYTSPKILAKDEGKSAGRYGNTSGTGLATVSASVTVQNNDQFTAAGQKRFPDLPQAAAEGWQKEQREKGMDDGNIFRASAQTFRESLSKAVASVPLRRNDERVYEHKMAESDEDTQSDSEGSLDDQQRRVVPVPMQQRQDITVAAERLLERVADHRRDSEIERKLAAAYEHLPAPPTATGPSVARAALGGSAGIAGYHGIGGAEADRHKPDDRDIEKDTKQVKQRKLTVPKSPKFSTMSWQRRQEPVVIAAAEKKMTSNADKKRSISTGRMR